MTPQAGARLLWLLIAVSVPLLAVACGGSASPPLQPTAAVRTSGPGRCSTAVAPESLLAAAPSSMLKLGGSPFGVAVSPDGRWVFVVLGGQVAVLSGRGTTPALVREISLPGQGQFSGLGAGDAITHDGRYLLVASGDGAIVIDAHRAETGSDDPVLGTLGASQGNSNGLPGGSAIEVTISKDDRFAFVSLEYADEIAVFDLQAALADHLRSSGFVGTIRLGEAVVGTAVSPDGKWLYATSELAAGARPTPQLVQGNSRGPYGTVSVISVARAESNPASAVVATASAGCGTVRVAASPDGRVVWVTARESDDLLAFSASALRNDPRHALLARVPVGEAPVGLTLLDSGRYVAVVDSDRFNAPGATASLTIVDTHAALAGKPALLGTVATGLFPREITVEPDQTTLLVTNFASGQLESVRLLRLH